MQEIEKAKEISGYCWKAFKQFMTSEHQDDDWKAYIKAGDASQAYEGAEKQLFTAMFLVFMDYAEDCEKRRGN